MVQVSAKAQAQPQGLAVLGTDTIHFPETILKGDTIMAVFHIANHSNAPFKIYQVYASCQCTAPQYAHDTFQPGRVDSVVMFFHSKNTTETSFEKYVLLLTPIGERAFFLKGTMYTPTAKDRTRKPKMHYINNTIKS